MRTISEENSPQGRRKIKLKMGERQKKDKDMKNVDSKKKNK
jgi:hypothetical protein